MGANSGVSGFVAPLGPVAVTCARARGARARRAGRKERGSMVVAGGKGGWKGLVGGTGEGKGEKGRGESYIRARPPSISRLGRANAETSEAGTHLDRKPHGELQRRRCLVLLTWRVQRPRASHHAHTLCMPRCTSSSTQQPVPGNTKRTPRTSAAAAP